MDVSIVIINYKTYALTKQCIETVLHYTKSIEYEIIVVDNCSDDGSINKLQEDFPCIIAIENEQNLGFGRANNVGIERASGKYVFMLNSDTLLVQNAILEMYNFMENHGEYGACGCNLIDKEGNLNLSYGNLPSLSYEFLQLGLYRLCRNYYRNKLSVGQTIKAGDPKNVGYISGADIFMRKSIFDEIGGFDKNIFMYFEETDLFTRMKKTCIKSCVLPEVKIIHLEGGSIKKSNINKFRLFETSRMYYYRKHHSFAYCMLVKLCVITNVLLNQKEDRLQRAKILCHI